MYKIIQDLCSERGISVSKLERDLKFPRGVLYKWDSCVPGVDKVKKVADYFNLPIEYFLSNED